MNHKVLTVSSTVTSIPEGAYMQNDVRPVKALLIVEGANLRVMTDGTAPTTTTGLQVRAGGSMNLDNYDSIRNFQAVAESGTATVTVVIQ